MTNVTRREFLRLAGLMGGATLFAGCSLFHESGPVPEYIKGAPGVDPLETLKGVKNIYTVCALCPGNCGICCRVAQGTVVKIGGNPYNPVSTGSPLPFSTSIEEAASVGASVCAIGGSGIQTLYDPFRVAKPLKRVGMRGSGKWKALTWDDAIREIAEGGNLFGEGSVKGLKGVKDSGKGLSFLTGRTDWGSRTFIKLFLSAFPGATEVSDRSGRMWQNASAAAAAVFGPEVGPIAADYGEARCVLSFGDAPLDSGIPLVSIARQIADARIDGRLKWAVVDPRLSTSASKSDLWAPIVPGTDVNLALAIMKALLEDHPEALNVPRDQVVRLVEGMSVDGLAESCGLSTEIPRRLAKMLADSGERSAVIPGGGILSQPNALDAATVILSLNRIVGSVPGSGGLVRRDDGFLKRAEKEILGEAAEDRKPGELGGPCDVLMAWRSDPVYDNPQEMTSYFKDRTKVPLSVSISTQITETAALADYILPDTTYLERWDICESPSSVAAPGIGMRSPAVGGFDTKSGRYFPIVPETRTMEDILIQVGSYLGFPFLATHGPIGPKTAWGFYRKATHTVLEHMKQAGFPVSGSLKHVSQVLERGGIFRGKSKGQTVAPEKAGTPSFDPKRFTAQEAKKPSRADTLMLISYTLPFHRSPASGLNQWLLEVLPENRLAMNSADASKKGIHQGDTITVRAADGTTSFTCKAQIMPGIRPGVVALARGFGYRASGADPQIVNGKPTSHDTTRGAGANPAILSAGKGLTLVRVEKA